MNEMMLEKVIKGLGEAAAYFRSSFDAMDGTLACEMFRDWAEAIEQAITLLDEILGDDSDEEDHNNYCIFLAPEESDDHDAPMWFSQWIKYSDDLPQSVKNWLEHANVEPGESAPIFSGGNADVMRFKYKGMAEKTAEKIGEMYPDLNDRLHVMVYEDKTDDDFADGIDGGMAGNGAAGRRNRP